MAFTVIDGDTSWQDLAIAQELATSYNYRRSAFGLSTISTPTNASLVFAFVQALQNGIEEMLGYNYYGLGAYYGWLLNTAALSTYTGQSTTYPTPLTLATGMTAAGLTASGYWRRIAEGGTQPATWTNYAAAGWSYGKITDKDLAGPWLFKDLQTVLSIMTRASFRHTQGRRKYGYNSGTVPIPSTALSWGSWGSSANNSNYSVSKRKTGSTIDYAPASIEIGEVRFDFPSAFDALETARILLTMPHDGAPSYASKASKMAYANLGVADVSTVMELSVSNTSTKSVAGGTLSYYGVIGEDASNLVPLANNILPDSSIPNDTTVTVDLYIYIPTLVIDFTFE